MRKYNMIFAPGVRFKVVAGNPNFQDQVGVVTRCPSSGAFVARIAPRPSVWDNEDGTQDVYLKPECEVIFGTYESEFMMIDQEVENASPQTD